MRKLVRLLLIHYDRFGVIALVCWLACMIGIVAIPSLIAQEFFVKFMKMSVRLAGFPIMLIVSPIVIFVSPVSWAAGLLLVERQWMLIGLYSLFGWEPFRFRKLIGRLAQEKKPENREK